MLLSTQWLSNMEYRGALIPAALWMEGDSSVFIHNEEGLDQIMLKVKNS